MYSTGGPPYILLGHGYACGSIPVCILPQGPIAQPCVLPVHRTQGPVTLPGLMSLSCQLSGTARPSNQKNKEMVSEK